MSLSEIDDQSKEIKSPLLEGDCHVIHLLYINFDEILYENQKKRQKLEKKRTNHQVIAVIHVQISHHQNGERAL